MNSNFELEAQKMNYRVILCKFNEIGLKSEKYKSQLLVRLTETIKKFCARENLHPQSILNISSRIICFFPSGEIVSACRVFKFIFGIQSFAPAVSSPRKLGILANNCIEYLGNLCQINPFNSFTINLRGDLHLISNKGEFSSKLLEKILKGLSKSRISLQYQNNEPEVELSIEIRPKGTYLYHREFPTSFAGFPTESKSVFLLPWKNTKMHLLAGLLLARRGAIVVPVEISSQLDSKDGKNGVFLRELAKFYPDPLPKLSLDENILREYAMKVDKTLSQKMPQEKNSLFDQVSNFLWIKTLDFLCLSSMNKAIQKMGGRNLHYRGMIFPLSEIKNSFDELDLWRSLLPLIRTPIYFPSAGFSEKFVVNALEELLKHTLNFSFDEDLNKQIFLEQHSTDRKFKWDRTQNFSNFSESIAFSGRLEVEIPFFEKILKNFESKFLSGKIL